MPNLQNLKSIGDLTKEEQRKITSKGGKASVEARRKRKALREELLLLLEKGETQKKISISLIEQAMKGNVKAFEVIRDTIGEKPNDKLELQNNEPFEVNITVRK